MNFSYKISFFDYWLLITDYWLLITDYWFVRITLACQQRQGLNGLNDYPDFISRKDGVKSNLTSLHNYHYSLPITHRPITHYPLPITYNLITRSFSHTFIYIRKINEIFLNKALCNWKIVVTLHPLWEKRAK